MNTRARRGFSDPRRAAGLSLIELLLALALGIVVVTGIVQLFGSNSATYRSLHAQGRMQENARFALEFLSEGARSAGFFGCAPQRQFLANGLGVGAPDAFDMQRIVRPSERPGIVGDGVVFVGIERPGWKLVEEVDPAEPFPTLDIAREDSGLAVGDVMVMGNCEQAALFRITGFEQDDPVALRHRPAVIPNCAVQPPSAFNAAVNAPCIPGLDALVGTGVPYTLSILNRPFDADTTVGRLQNVEYFVADSALTGGRSLWQSVNGADAEMVPGVADLRILYGVDLDDDGVTSAHIYLTRAQLEARQPREQRSVVALRVTVTVTGADESGGQDVRRTFTRTVMLRNGRHQA